MVPSNNSHFQKRDNKELRSALQRIEKLNAVLASIRNVNQLITREKNPEKLIKRSCKLLTEQQGCHTAWIAHLDSEEKLLSVAQSGLGAKFTPLKKRIQRGEMPHCWHIVRKKKDAAIFKNPSKVCGDCPLPEKQENYCALSVGMYCKDRNFGILSVFIEPEYMDDKEFRDLFVEVAGDIALGLYNIEIEVSLKQSEARLLRAQRIGKLGNWEWDIEKNELHWCDEIYRIWDWQPDEPLTYEGIIQRIHPDNREFNEGYLREFLEDRDEGSFEFRISLPDGEVKYISQTIEVERGSDGKAIRMFGIMQDITAKKRAEQALLAEKERLNVTLRSIGDAVITTDMKGNVILINSIAEKLTGWSENEAKGQHITSIFAIVNEHTRETAENPVEKVLKWGITVGLANHTVLISRDGQDRFIDDSGAPIRNEDGEIVGVVLVFRDVTDQRRMQEYLSRAQRLETAGQIAGQIAHDFNNLLGPLIAYPDFIRMQIPNGHEVLNFVNDMEKAAEQIAEINQQLLTLSRRGYYKQEALDLNEIVSDAINQTKPHADTLLINLEPEEELYRVKGGRSQIYRVIVNLLNNAREAMTDIGTLTVRTENFYVDEIFGKFGRVPKGEYVKLSIIDTGHGISNDLLSKIFDPFFTTKEADKRRGSGLGLSVVHAVVQDHKAFIDLETTIGKGTAFYIYFPLTREEAGRSEPESIIRGNNESVLVVDDDVIQREVSLRLLSELGYRAEAAKSGEEAIELLKEGPRDLLLLDMVMPPGMDGTETYQKAVQINPEQKAIIISGFAESERVRKLQELGAGEYIRKPLNMKVLSAAVRRELERTGEPENKLRD